MTDQEKADIELSLAMIDQTIATQSLTKSTNELKSASDMEVDASLDLTDSKEKVMDQMSDLEYSLHEQNRAEKRYLNILSRRLDIEQKIGLVDYSQIDKRLHDKIVAELEKRLKEEQEKNKRDEENNNEEEETDTQQRKTDAEYLREAEKFHKKQKGMFQRISDSHKSYMQNSSSFFGRLAMGALGKGTSELLGAVDSATDMIPGVKTAKRVGGFVKDQWKESKEQKRQNKIEKTAKFLRARDEAPKSETEERQKTENDTQQRKGTEGILGMGTTLGKILEFLKKLGETLMFMGIFKSLFGLIGSAIGGMAGLISKGVTAALTGLGIVGLLKGLSTAITTGLSGLASALKMKIPGLETPDTPDVDKNKKTPKTTPKNTPKKPGRFARLWNATKEVGSKGGRFVAQNLSRGSVSAMARGGASLAMNPITIGAGAALYSSKVGEGSDDTSEFADVEKRAKVAERNKKSMLEGYSKEYKDSYGDKPLIDDNGNVYYYPNPKNDRDIQVENERRFKMDVNTGLVENNEKTFNELTQASSELERVKSEKEAAQRQQVISSIGQANTTNNINSTVQQTKTFGFSPYDYSSRGTGSRGETK